MFVMLLHYLKPLPEVDRFVDEHRTFLERHYAAGDFLLSGRQQPRTGGVIIARAQTREQIEAIVREDPFHREQIARYEIVEFVPSLADARLAQFKEA